MSKRTIEERIQELRAKQTRQLLHEQARAHYDAIKPLLSGRYYDDAHNAALALAKSIVALQAAITGAGLVGEMKRAAAEVAVKS